MVFMGTPHFAAQTLEQLLKNYSFEAVVTQPDRPQGRGLVLTPSPVKKLAQTRGIEILQPEKTKDTNFVNRMKEISPDLIIVVAYGALLRKDIIAIPRLGCINLHSSLLPKYRGATPVQWALMNAETETGWTTFYIDEGLDSGDMILQRKITIDPHEDAATLFEKMSIPGIKLLEETIDQVIQGKAPRIKQICDQATFAPRLKKENGLINWKEPAFKICNRIRGLIPWPMAHTFIEWKGKRLELKIFKASAHKDSAPPGEIFKIDSKGIWVGTGEGSLTLQELQLEGSRRMNAQDFLRGHPLQAGIHLG